MLEVSHLSYKEILHDLNFSVADGSFTVIVGKNGSGKSCLLRCIKGLYHHSGTVKCSGSSGLVFQDADTQIIGSTVRRDLSYGLRSIPKTEISAKVEAVAEEFGLTELLDRRPSTLSGGEKRRLAIADIAITEPAVMMLDEPFANLDYPGIQSTVRLLKQLKARGRTIILVSHEIEKILALADQIIILSSGRIINQGPSDEVFKEADWNAAGIRATGSRKDMLWD